MTFFKYIFLICILAIPFNVFSQPSDEIEGIIQEINQLERIQLKHTADKIPPFFYIMFVDKPCKKLQQVCSLERLWKLTTHSSPNVRAVALFALLSHDERDNLPFHELLPPIFQDTSTIKISRQNWGNSTTSIGMLYLELVGNYGNSVDYMGIGFKLSETEQYLCDSTFLCSNTPFNHMKNKIYYTRKKMPETWRDCIRTSIAQGDQYSSLILSKYENPEDIDLILGNLPPQRRQKDKVNWFSLGRFKHNKIYEYLISQFEGYWNDRSYQNQLYRYPKLKTLELIDTTYQRILKLERRKKFYQVTTFFRSLKRNFHNQYADILVKIMEDNPTNSNLFYNTDTLWLYHPKRMLSIIDTLENGDKFQKMAASRMLPLAMKYIKSKDENAYKESIVARLETGTPFRAYSGSSNTVALQSYREIFMSKDPYYIDPLFKNLEQETIPENRFFIAKILQSYHSDSIDNRLENLFREKPELAPTLEVAEKTTNIMGNFEHYSKRK